MAPSPEKLEQQYRAIQMSSSIRLKARVE